MFERIEKGFLVISWACCLIVTFIVVVDVGQRWLFNKPLPGSWEVSEVLMPFIVIYAFPRTLTEGVHVRVELISRLFSPKIQYVLEIIVNIFGFLLCVVVSWRSAEWFWHSFGLREEILAAVHIPWYIGKFTMPSGFTIFGINFLFRLINNLRNLRSVLRTTK